MRTEHLDNKINELETLRSRGELTYIGGEMLSEFNEIKRALSIAPVSGSFSATDVERAYDDGYSTEGEVTFDIENYR